MYDVSMAWARALWDVRRLLAGANGLGQTAARRLDLADQLVMQSYLSVHGWSSNFEVAAEGLIAAARTILPNAPWNLNAAALKLLVAQIIQAFTARHPGRLRRAGPGPGQPQRAAGVVSGDRHGPQAIGQPDPAVGELDADHREWQCAAGNRCPGDRSGATRSCRDRGGVYRWDNSQAGTSATRGVH
ncbi:MAG: hypothetical protein HZY76_15140 [Anaerolineae bacterium]|nr:MAG: hypothetical protein HZY76_15140 [Anaerolineae bacterium]